MPHPSGKGHGKTLKSSRKKTGSTKKKMTKKSQGKKASKSRYKAGY
jgi:hypothetical protein